MKIILVSQEQFDCIKTHTSWAVEGRILVGNVPTPSIINVLENAIFMIAEEVSVHRTDKFNYNGGPISIASIYRAATLPENIIKMKE